MASADDYAWTVTELPFFCFSLVRGVSGADLLDRLQATDRDGPISRQQLWHRSYDTDPASGRALTGVKDPGGWCVWLEPNGYTATAAGSLSADGGRLVVVENNPKGGGNFYWYEDGDLKLMFEPAFAVEREGSDPDALYDEMQRLGFEVEEVDDDDYDVGPVDQAAYALMEHLTGICLTPEQLADGYLTGLVRLPG